ncbi:MAG: transglutaminase-like domain-containing protein [Pirellulaceae bacterium]|nr:transglutaminase domain-containing protein [Planctomycetales bacterium]
MIDSIRVLMASIATILFTVATLMANACVAQTPASVTWQPATAAAMAQSGDNQQQLEAAYHGVNEQERVGLEFLLQNMPVSDLQSLTSDFLVEHVRYAYQVRNEVEWAKQIPEEIFLNNVLPYASINERRDGWRKDFFERFTPLVENCPTAALTATKLNREIFPLLNVRYSTKRPKPDQSPYETIEATVATCTGLSVLLIDACRAVGVPARFAGTPLWSDMSGNHSWVEIWDQDWHVLGAAEQDGDKLDSVWFSQRAAQAKRDEPRHAIYATSFRRTPLRFPLVWDRRNHDVYAVNVTDRYTSRQEPLPDGALRVYFRAISSGTGERQTVQVSIKDAEQREVFHGATKDERFDMNDHLSAALPSGGTYELKALSGGTTATTTFTLTQPEQLVTVEIGEPTDNGRQAPAASQ